MRCPAGWITSRLSYALLRIKKDHRSEGQAGRGKPSEGVGVTATLLT